MLELVTAALILVGLASAVRWHGANSLPTFGALGLLAYTFPALLDLQVPFALAGAPKIATSTPLETDLTVTLSWLMFVAVILLGARATPNREIIVASADQRTLGRFAAIASALWLAGQMYLSAENGLFYFLDDREAQRNDLLTILWKWSVPSILIPAIIIQNKKLLSIAIIALLIIFLRGDRTMVAVCLFGALIAYRENGGRVLSLISPRRITSILSATILLVFGKPIYLYVKSLGSDGARFDLNWSALMNSMLSFEPLSTIYHIDFVSTMNIKISFYQFIASVFSNFTVFPSLFNLDTNLYNRIVTDVAGPGLTYGVAGSFLAHGYSVGGYLGVGVFVALFTTVTIWLDRKISKSTGPLKTALIIIGSTMAIYIHRNGMDNFFSFVRQIALVTFAIGAAVSLSFGVSSSRQRSERRGRRYGIETK